MLFGDDIDFRAHAHDVDLAGFPAMVFMLRRAGSGTPALNRARQAATLMATGGRAVVEQMANHCSGAGALAHRLGLSADVQAGIEQAYARWDGRGVPGDLAGDALALSARISHVAEACEVFQRTAGIDAAVEVIRDAERHPLRPRGGRRGPARPGGALRGIDRDTVEEVLEAEPIRRAPP